MRGNFCIDAGSVGITDGSCSWRGSKLFFGRGSGKFCGEVSCSDSNKLFENSSLFSLFLSKVVVVYLPGASLYISYKSSSDSFLLSFLSLRVSVLCESVCFYWVRSWMLPFIFLLWFCGAWLYQFKSFDDEGCCRGAFGLICLLEFL